MSLHCKKIGKAKFIRKPGGPKMDKITRRLRKVDRNNILRNQSLKPRLLFAYLASFIAYFGDANPDRLKLLNVTLFLLKKLSLLIGLLIWRILKSLLDEDIGGN